MNKCFFLFFLISTCLIAQNLSPRAVIKTVEIEINGNPTWQKIIPLGSQGLLLFIKKDITKAVVIKFNTDLIKVWETDIVLDVEKKPTAYCVDNRNITFLFSENQGMYYQLLTIDLKNGNIENTGFELREYFKDQGYANLNNRILMAGRNEKEGVFYDFDFKTNEGKFIATELHGKTELQHLKYNSKTRLIETLWAVKELSYTNEKKRKGEFIKNTYVVFAKYDTLGKLIVKTAIQPNIGKFPLTAQLTHIDSLTSIITGVYQSNTGVKGIYFSRIERDKTTLTRFYGYEKLLIGTKNLSNEYLKKLSSEYSFSPAKTIFCDNQIMVGGSFYQLNLGMNRVGKRASKNNEIKNALMYDYSNTFSASFDLKGNLIAQQAFTTVQSSSNLDEILAVNKSIILICLQGNLVVYNLRNNTEKREYKLSVVEENNIFEQFSQNIPSYRSVMNWYDDYFIAEGSRIDECITEKKVLHQKALKRKKNTMTKLRKTIYLSKVLPVSKF